MMDAELLVEVVTMRSKYLIRRQDLKWLVFAVIQTWLGRCKLALETCHIVPRKIRPMPDKSTANISRLSTLVRFPEQWLAAETETLDRANQKTLWHTVPSSHQEVGEESTVGSYLGLMTRPSLFGAEIKKAFGKLSTRCDRRTLLRQQQESSTIPHQLLEVARTFPVAFPKAHLLLGVRRSSTILSTRLFPMVHTLSVRLCISTLHWYNTHTYRP
jgi:hypothetical protein